MNKKTYKQIGIFILINILAIAYAACYSLKDVPCLEDGSPCELEGGTGVVMDVKGTRLICHNFGPGHRDCNATGTTIECTYTCGKYYWNLILVPVDRNRHTTVDSATLSGEECTYQ